MKRILLSMVVMVVGVVGAKAQGFVSPTVRCNIGLLYQISYQENWGDSQAVVVEVIPDTPASRAGIKVGDVIRKVDGQETIKMDEEVITSRMIDPSRNSVTLTIARIGQPDKDVVLQKDCVSTDVLREEQLVKAFSMYSLEDAASRRFTMPFIYTLPTKRDFAKYTTFAIEKAMAGKQISRLVAAELAAKGMKEVTSGADLLVVIKAEMGDNPEYREGSTANLNPNKLLYRADGKTFEVLPYPFLGVNAPVFSGLYRLTIDVELYDTKDNTKIWSVTARERMNEQFSPDKYVEAFGRYMFANYPFVRYVMNPTYVIHKQQFRYLGLGYDAKDLQLVREVIANSPAARAGIVPGDRIVSINGIALDSSSSELTKKYKRFISETWRERDENSTFTNDEGFNRCRYWDNGKYAKVAQAIDNPKYGSAFAYLFSHRPYISVTPIEEIVLDIVRNGAQMTIIVKPELKDLDYIELN